MARHDQRAAVRRDWCPIGPMHMHTMNFERTECIWCGPGRLAWKPGHWVALSDDTQAWSATEPFELGATSDD